eukprot:Amastigsp_a510606_11.p4 type:complete len:100 gc:universal Amastigsp_a510606_11:50-349(+)
MASMRAAPVSSSDSEYASNASPASPLSRLARSIRRAPESGAMARAPRAALSVASGRRSCVWAACGCLDDGDLDACASAGGAAAASARRTRARGSTFPQS